MAWIELHEEVWSHPKTTKLARRLSISKTYAAAHMMRLWTWATKFAANGDLSAYDAVLLADAADWVGDEELFLTAVIESGYIDKDGESLCIHDWQEYAGRLIDYREKDAKRKRQIRNSGGNTPFDDGNPDDNQRTSNGCPADVQRMSSGRPADVQRMSSGCPTDVQRTSDGVQRMSDGVHPLPIPIPVPIPKDSNISSEVSDGDEWKPTKKDHSYSKDAVELTHYLISQMQANNPQVRVPKREMRDKWYSEMVLLLRIDKRKPEDVKAVITWCQNDSFWKSNILSPFKLREKYDQILLQSQRQKNPVTFPRAQNVLRSSNFDQRQYDDAFFDELSNASLRKVAPS